MERKKGGEFVARPIFDREIVDLFYAVRDADTGDWISAMYRVKGGEKKRSDGWEYSWEYPDLDGHPDLYRDRAYLLVMLDTAEDGLRGYAPVGPSEVRMALAVVFGLVGIAMTVGKTGGRRLPLVAADLLKYRLAARRYAGPVSQLVRAEPPAPAQPVKSGPGPVSLMAKRAGRGLGRLRKNRKTRKNRERRNGRMRWFGKRRGKGGGNPHG